MPHFEDGWHFSHGSGYSLSPDGCRTVRQIHISSPSSDHCDPDIPSHGKSPMSDFEESGFDASLSPRFTSINASPPASPSASPFTISPGPRESETATIIIPNWRDNDKPRRFSCTDSSVFADPIFKDTMKKADKITRSGIDPTQSRSELSALVDSANAAVSWRRRQQEQDGTLGGNYKIPVFTLLPAYKDRGTDADFSDQGAIWDSVNCPIAKKERDLDSLKSNLRELFPGREMFYGQSPNNSDEIYNDTRMMQDWEERAKGATKRVDNKWRHPIRRRDCPFIIPVIPPTITNSMGGLSIATNSEKLEQNKGDPETDTHTAPGLDLGSVGMDRGRHNSAHTHYHDRGKQAESFADGEGRQGQNTTDLRNTVDD